MGKLKKGLKIEIDKISYKIGNGVAFVWAKIKSFLDGKVIEKTFHVGDKCEEPNIIEKAMQHLYHDGDLYQLMDIENY